MKGEDRIRRYLERAFYGVEKNEKVREEMEALLGELLEKYQSLTAQGYEPEAAYQSVISGIGDIFELVDGIAQEAQAGRPPLGGPADLRQTDGFGSGWKSSPRMLEAAPYVAAAGLLLLWGGSLLFPAGPRARTLTPVLMLALGIGGGCGRPVDLDERRPDGGPEPGTQAESRADRPGCRLVRGCPGDVPGGFQTPSGTAAVADPAGGAGGPSDDRRMACL